MAEKKRKLVFMGSDPIALPSLEFLAEQSDQLKIAAVFTQPDRRTGRGRKLQANAIKLWAEANKIEVFQPEKPGESEVEWMRENEIDLILVMAYGHILRQNLIESVPLKIYNLHASLLPKYRGASPIEAAIAEGESETGVTLMEVVRKLDAGPIVDAEKFPIDRFETGGTAAKKIAEASVPLLKRNIPAMLSGTTVFHEQREEEANYTRKLEKTDGNLDFSKPAKVLAARINALMPWPASFINFKNQRIKIGLADWIDETSKEKPGTILESDSKGLKVATDKGILSLLSLQRPGGRMLSAADFLRGFPIAPGTVLISEPMSQLVADKPFSQK